MLFKIYLQISLFKLVLELGGKGYIVTRRNGVSISIPECGIIDLGHAGRMPFCPGMTTSGV